MPVTCHQLRTLLPTLIYPALIDLLFYTHEHRFLLLPPRVQTDRLRRVSAVLLPASGLFLSLFPLRLLIINLSMNFQLLQRHDINPMRVHTPHSISGTFLRLC